MRCSTNASFSSGCIWHRDSPSSAKQDDSTLLSLCETCYCYLPCCLKLGVFTSLGRIGGLASVILCFFYPPDFQQCCNQRQSKGQDSTQHWCLSNENSRKSGGGEKITMGIICRCSTFLTTWLLFQRLEREQRENSHVYIEYWRIVQDFAFKVGLASG